MADFTYEWKWGPMRTHTVDQLPNVVFGIDYICLYGDPAGDIRSKQSGTIPVPQPDPDNFVTIDQVTAAMIANWIEQWGKKLQIEAAATEILESLLHPQETNFPIPSGV
jgi:hypothetical protein